MDKPSIPPSFAARAAVPPGLDARSAAVLREIVEQYVETGEPVGSRTLSRRLPLHLSPATIRNVMADLTDTVPEGDRAPAPQHRTQRRLEPAGGHQRGSLGRPSTRSPRMLRRISDVPPSIEFASERR